MRPRGGAPGCASLRHPGRGPAPAASKGLARRAALSSSAPSRIEKVTGGEKSLVIDGLATAAVRAAGCVAPLGS